ncbi:MAG TPA: PAS domain S-box protein [Rhodocyclaceae bacterium]
MHQVVESAPSAMVIVDSAGRLLLVNAQSEKLFGYPRDALIGQPVEMLVPERFRGAHPAYRESFSRSPQSRPMGSGRDLYCRRRDGSEFPVEIGLNPINTELGPMVLAAIVDITERKRQEERFRRVVEYAPSAMVMADSGGRIVLANAQAELMFGYERGALPGLPVEALVPGRFRPHHPGHRREFGAAPQARPMGVGRDLFACRRDGSEFPVEIGLNPIDTEEGPMVLAAIVDITERRRVRQHLENTLQEKTVLLNEVHHRVKNNLQVISSLLNLQARHVSDPQVRAILNESQNRVKSIALTHQLLYERKEFSRVDLVGYLKRLVQLLISTYPGSTQRIVLRLEVDGEPVALDLERAVPCGLVVNELVTNAFKHAFPDNRSGEVCVALRHTDEGVLLTVADNGIGLPAGFAMDKVQSLGLQLVPLLIDQLHGSLAVASQAGTRFELRFQVEPTNGDAHE